MEITGTDFNYYLVCHRKLWLFSKGITMEQDSDLVLEGRLVHQESYPERNPKYEEVQIDGIKVDYYDAKNKVIHEVKKSNKLENASILQLKYYIYVFEHHGINGVTGMLEFPTQRETTRVALEDSDREKITNMLEETADIICSDECPRVEKKTFCRNCSYFDFCFSGEKEE